MWGRGSPSVVLVALAAAAAFAAAPARAEPSLVFGFSDDAAKWDGARITDPAREVGATALRLGLHWSPGQTELDATTSSRLDYAIAAAGGMRIVLAATGASATPPLDDTARDQFCAYVRSALVRYPSIDDVVIWNEPNLSYFWKQQWNPDGTSAAPVAYEALLARCWDVLHEYKPTVKVLAPATSPRGNDDPSATSNISHSPVNFIKKLADAYRASGRQQRIFDGVVQHVYGNSNKERPFQMHLGNTIVAEGDWNKLVRTLDEAFEGTPQTVPGQQCYLVPCVPIWYLESGWQTSIDPAKAAFYSGIENVVPIPADAGGEATSTPAPDSAAPDQATQLRYALRVAYCQPYVAGIFNFAIRDDPKLPGWQSGVLWADYTPKPSYFALQQVVAELGARNVSCAPPTAPTELEGGPLGSPLRVALSWSASSSAIGVAGYRIYRNGIAFWQTASGPGFVDRRVKPDTTYTYSVRALDAAGNVGASSPTIVVSTTDPPSTFGAVGDDDDTSAQTGVPLDETAEADGTGTPVAGSCPGVADPAQPDWDRDGLADSCDRSARVTLRVKVQSRRVTLAGSVRPAGISAQAWRVLVWRRSCRRSGCSYVRVRTVRGRPKGPAGSVLARTWIARAGLYRFQAVLRDRRYEQARSAPVVRRVG